MDSRYIKSQMDYLVGNFKQDVCRVFGISEERFALFVQANIEGNYYAGADGDLNGLLPSRPAAASSEGGFPEVSSLVSLGEGTDAGTAGERQDDFFRFMEQEIRSADSCESTRRNHLTTLKNLREFRCPLRFADLNAELLYGFKQFMAEKGFSPNTMVKHFKHLKHYVKVAIDKGRMVHYPFRNFKVRSVETRKASLSLAEIEEIERYRAKHPEPAEFGEMIDGFLFSCYTGMRYSDICRLTMQHFQVIDRKWWIVMPTRKTGTVVRIPLYLLFEGKGLAIVGKYRKRRGLLFRLPSNNKANRWLAALMRRLGIPKHITFHSARHTNATLLLYKGVPVTTVQKLLGHKDIKTTQVYSAVTDMLLVKELKEAARRDRRRTGVSVRH